jgi:hypothetical protein
MCVTRAHGDGFVTGERLNLLDAHPCDSGHEQNVWRLECHVYPVISASLSAGRNHQRQSAEGPRRGKTESDGLWVTKLRWDLKAAIVALLNGTFRAARFLLFNSRIMGRSRSTCDQIRENWPPTGSITSSAFTSSAADRSLPSMPPMNCVRPSIRSSPTPGRSTPHSNTSVAFSTMPTRKSPQ